MLTQAEIDESYRRCEVMTARWAKSFHFASRFLPRDKRRAVFALYDYCRFADNLVDERGGRPTSTVRADLAALGGTVRYMRDGIPPAEPHWLALYDTLQRYPIPLAPLLELLQGVAQDLEPVDIPDFPALLRYCRLVAGGVGLMMGPILGASSDAFDDLGINLGIAMQLTNVLRDVDEDLRNGRIYLPADELREWRIPRAMLEARRMTPELRAFIVFQVTRARSYFQQADPILPLFPDDGSRLTVRLLQQTYAGILDEIERQDFNVFSGRASVPLRRKLLILGRAVREGAGRLHLQHLATS
jgi:phytoene synthase